MKNKIRRTRLLQIMSAVLFSTCLTAGSPDDQPNDSGALLSVIHSERLRGIMQRLDSLAYEREYTALELDRIRQRRLGDLVDVTRELMENSRQLEEIAPDSKLSTEDIVTFRAIASQLHQETLGLEEQLHHGQTTAINQGYERLRDTCNACHRLFRNH